MAEPINYLRARVGENRNVDLRREFHKRLDKSSVSATSIFNGAFADMLTDQVPLILFKLKLGIPGERERDSGMMPNANPG